MQRLKEGVRLLGISPVMCMAHSIVASVFDHFGYECVVTSGIEGTHSWSSEHYKGDALDYRSKHITHQVDKGLILDTLREALGQDFDILIESVGTANEHYHVEYDPKKYY